ncbi:hypothetical protein [Weissella confusa]|uniref:hypothetical protein n=1 Tax=Weissella confusa TaxID=1583 RepID=UPI002E1F70CD|nr:hypothetical protein [Weissella confusa]
MGRRKKARRNYNKPTFIPDPAKNVTQFFGSISAPAFDFPFNLLTWISMGEYLAGGNRVMAGNVPGMLKIKSAFPKYSDYLMDSVGIYDANSFKQHSEAWQKAKKQPICNEQNDKSSSVQDSISTASLTENVEPQVKIKRKVKIVATTGAAGVSVDQKTQPVGKSKKPTSPKQDKTKQSGKRSETPKPNKKVSSTKGKKRVASNPIHKDANSQHSSINHYSYVRYTRVSARERDNLFYSDNSYDNY